MQPKESLPVIDQKIEIKMPNNSKELIVNKGQINFENVNFKYDLENQVQVLKDINITIDAGKMTALVGLWI